MVRNDMKNIFTNNSFLPSSYSLIAKNTGLLIALQLLQRLLGLATTYFVVRALGQDGFGNYQFVLSVVGVVAIFGMPGLNNAVMQSVARGFRGTYRASIRPAVLGALVGATVLAGITGWAFLTNPNGPAAALFGALLLFVFAHGLTQWKGLKSGTEDFAGVVKLSGSASIATSLLLIGSVVFLTDSYAALVIVIFAVQGVLNLLATWMSLRSVRPDEPVEKGSIRYGVVTTGWMVFGCVAMYVDKLLIYTFMSPASLAIFVAAERVPGLTKEFIKNLGAALAPRFARHSHYTKRVDRAFQVFSVVAGFAIVAFAFTLLPWFIVLVFGEEYRESVPYAQALMCSIAIVNSVPLRSRWIRSRQDTASFRDVSIIMALCRIVVSAALIPFFGLTGAVVSAFISRIGYVITVTVVMKKRYPLSERDE